MPSQALRRLQKLAGIQLPARYQTLGNLLDICLDAANPPETVASAIELDPALLAAFLGFSRSQLSVTASQAVPIKYWYRDIDPAFFPALGTAMAHEFLIDAPDDEALQQRTENWRQSILHSLLAAQMASRLESVDIDEARLAALLAGLGPDLMALLAKNREQPLDHMIEHTNEEQADLLADLLASWGCEAPFCDAIRYHPIELNMLADASDLIKVVASSRHLKPFVEGPEMVTPTLARDIHSSLGFDEDVLYEVIGKASRRFDDIKKTLQIEASHYNGPVTLQRVSRDDTASNAWCRFKTHLNNETLAAVFHQALSRANRQTPFDTLIGNSGHFLFAFKRVVHMIPEGEHLKGIVGRGGTNNESITVPKSSSQSLVAKCYRQQHNETISYNDNTSVTDRQLLRRSNSDTLLCISLGEQAGVLVCGIESDVPGKLAKRRHLLNSYADAIAHAWAVRQSRQQLDIDTVKRRFREISHEANNPLSIVQNYLQTLSLKLQDNAAAQKDIEAISNEIMRASDIISTFDRIDIEGGAPDQEVNVNATVKELVDIFLGSYEDIIFKTDLDPGMPTTFVPADDLRQAFVNLIKNAVESLLADERVVDRGKQIVVSSCGSVNLGGHKYIEIAIADNGPGISPDIREKLFRPHVSTKGGDHAGLGLSIARQLIETMGGIITCKSRIEEEGTPGTSFQIFIPHIETTSDREQ